MLGISSQFCLSMTFDPNSSQGGHTFGSWRAIFLLGAAVYAFGGAVYVPFIRAEPQPWNDPAPLASREGRMRNEGEKCDERRNEMEEQL